jgi:hypothetical protein
MKVRRPLKYVLIVAGLAAGWAAGGLLDRHGEPGPVAPAGHREPQTRPQTRPATAPALSKSGDCLYLSNVAGTITARR